MERGEGGGEEGSSTEQELPGKIIPQTNVPFSLNQYGRSLKQTSPSPPLFLFFSFSLFLSPLSLAFIFPLFISFHHLPLFFSHTHGHSLSIPFSPSLCPLTLALSPCGPPSFSGCWRRLGFGSGRQGHAGRAELVIWDSQIKEGGRGGEEKYRKVWRCGLVISQGLCSGLEPVSDKCQRNHRPAPCFWSDLENRY